MAVTYGGTVADLCCEFGDAGVRIGVEPSPSLPLADSDGMVCDSSEPGKLGRLAAAGGGDTGGELGSYGVQSTHGPPGVTPGMGVVIVSEKHVLHICTVMVGVSAGELGQDSCAVVRDQRSEHTFQVARVSLAEGLK